MSSIQQGLILSLAGILITFAFFGLLILLMVLLRNIFKVPPQEKEPDKQEMAQDIDRRKAAGIAVAVAILKSERQADFSLGQVLETPPGRWWRNARHKE